MSDLEKILQLTRKKLEKNKFVDIHMAGDPGIASFVPFPYPTGLAELDYHFGGKCGLPAGKMIEYYGLPASGKTTLSYHAIVECQKLGGLALFVDSEQSFDEERAQTIGVNMKNLSVASTDTIESIFNTIEEFLASVSESKFNGPVIVVVDSITGVPTEFDIEQDMTQEGRIGQEAKQIRRGVRRLQGMLSKTKALVIFINHAVSKMTTMPYAKKTQAAGGYGIKFMEFIRLELKTTGQLKEGTGDDAMRIGQKVGFEIEKLKNAALPYPKIEEIQLLANGFDKITSLLNAGVKTNWIGKKSKLVYTLLDKQFDKDEWPQVIAGIGGYDTAYKSWKEHGIETGALIPWGA